MSENIRIALLIDWQNAWSSARTAFGFESQPNEFGNFSPFRLGNVVARAQDHRGRGTLTRVEVHRGLPSNERDSVGYGANRAQSQAWKNESPLVEPKLRPLRYPSSWGGSGPPQEKGVDVAIALAAVELTMSDACDVVVLFSNDTDLKPVIETVARLKDPSAIETASWSAPGFNQRLRGPGVFHHYVPRIQYGVVQDHVNYAHRGTR